MTRTLKMGLILLDQNKTRITPIEEGFDFLGFHFRKYRGKLRIKPAKKNVQTFLRNIREEIRLLIPANAEIVIRKLNPKIRGWANYYRTIASKGTMSYVDHHIFKCILRWVQRKHPNKSAKWQRGKYFRNHETRQWIFHSKVKDTQGNNSILDLERASNIKVIKHIKIRGEAHPYDPRFNDYFANRKRLQKLSELRVFGWLPAKHKTKACRVGCQ
ncbi:MAG: hypothetical protein JSR33_11250 [Proteobacteria bacterium]|nr:hypothetical protein [Pseudomonadota bacterium]